MAKFGGRPFNPRSSFRGQQRQDSRQPCGVARLRSSVQGLLRRRIGASVGTGSLVRKSMMILLHTAGFSARSPWEVPGTTASSASDRPR
jgi:hypothetical protein